MAALAMLAFHFLLQYTKIGKAIARHLDQP